MEWTLIVLLLAADPEPIKALGAPKWERREKAAATLAELPWNEAAPLLRKHLENKNPEIADRCHRLLSEHIRCQLDAREPFPFIDAFWYDAEKKTYVVNATADPSRWKSYECYSPYLERVGRDGRPWTNYRRATRHLVRDWLTADARTKADIDEILAELHRRDAVFLQSFAATPLALPMDLPP